MQTNALARILQTIRDKSKAALDYIVRPYIFNFVIPFKGSSAAEVAGQIASQLWSITPYDFNLIKIMAYASGLSPTYINVNPSGGIINLTSTGISQNTTANIPTGYVRLDTFAGDGSFPMIIQQGRMMKAGVDQFQINILDASGAGTTNTNNLYLSFVGEQYIYDPGLSLLKGGYSDFKAMFLGTGLLTVGANATVSQSIRITNGDFISNKIIIKTTSDCLVSIKYGGIYLMDGNNPIHSRNLAGEATTINGIVPFMLPAQMELRQGSDIEISVQDLSGATNYVDITIAGVSLLGA